MATELRVNTLKDASGNNSITTSFVAGGSAKARFTVNQANNTTALSSLNISSLADTATGRTTYNLSSAFSSANEHCAIGIGTDASTFYDYTIASHTASSAQFIQGASAHDIDFASITAHGDLA